MNTKWRKMLRISLIFLLVGGGIAWIYVGQPQTTEEWVRPATYREVLVNNFGIFGGWGLIILGMILVSFPKITNKPSDLDVLFGLGGCLGLLACIPLGLVSHLLILPTAFISITAIARIVFRAIEA